MAEIISAQNVLCVSGFQPGVREDISGVREKKSYIIQNGTQEPLEP
jgi:hypothetical protein